MDISIRRYAPSDFKQLADVYASAFAEPPWDEFKKCVACGVNYGITESQTATKSCKKCTNPLKLVEFWGVDEIRTDLNFALGQRNSIVLVASVNGNENRLVGMTWGYGLPIEKFPFLREIVDSESIYMDEIAVRSESRRLGIGKLLGEEFIQLAQNVKAKEVVLRTDQRNQGSMGLFRKLGFKSLGISDPEYEWRIYLNRKLKQ